MSINILYFSNYDESSKHLICLMQTEGLLKYFTQVCKDGNLTVPQNILTPTIIIKGVPQPYIQNEAFGWFARIKQWRIDSSFQRMAENQKQYIQHNLNANSNKGATQETTLLGFNKAEMEGMSDIFAFLSNDAGAANHSQLTYDRIGSDKIIGSSHGHDEEILTRKEQTVWGQQLLKERKQQDLTISKQLDEFGKQQYTGTNY